MEEKKTVYVRDDDFGNTYRLKLSEEAIHLLEWLKNNELLCETIEFSVDEIPLEITDVTL